MAHEEAGESIEHLKSGLLWALVRQQVQVEAVIEALSDEQPAFRAKVSKQLEQLKKSGRLKDIIDEVRREVTQSADGVWLIRNGIRDHPF